MSEYVYAGRTSQSIDLFIRDSSSTTGQGLTGLSYNSGSLVASYRKGANGSRTAITLATQTVGGAFSSGGFVEIDATNMPGCYRLDLPNAAVDTAGFVTVFMKGAANMVPVALRIDCRALPADIKQIGEDAQSAAALKDFADAGYDPSTHKVASELDSSSLRSALGMSAADLDAQLDAILAAASAGAGTGARTVTITVNDGTTALQNAVVRFTEGSNTFRALTNVSGVAVFNLDDATYTVAVTKSGYTYAGTTMVVDGTEAATYSMTAVSVTPPTNPDLSAIEVLCLDEDFAAAPGVDVDFRMSAVAAGDQNRAYPGAKKTVTSNGSGIARFEGPQGAGVEWKRGTGQQWTPATLDNDSVTNVTSLIGSP